MAFELAKMIAKQGLLTESLVYFTKALHLAEEDALYQQGELESVKGRSEILMHRSVAYEALGLQEMCARDVRSIAEGDTGFRLRYF